MRRFIINILIFCGLIVFIAVGLVILSEFCIKSRKSQLLRLRENITVVFSGDSNVECSVNDELIANSVNIATSGEAYFYSYAKIRALLEYNDQINKVFLGYSSGKLSKYIESRWLFSEEFIIEKVKNYNYVLSGSERKILFKSNSKAYTQGLLQSILFNFTGFISSVRVQGSGGKIYKFGGYKYLERNKLKEDIERQGIIDPDAELQNQPGQFQEKYLKLISDLCKEKSVKLILLDTPKYQYLPDSGKRSSPDSSPGKFTFVPSDSILDLSRLILPDSCFADITHLNYKGATIFSEYLNSLINNDLVK